MAKRRKKPLLKRLENQADRFLSLYVRAMAKKEFGNCPLCGVNPIQCCFHFISRRRKILRWDLRNVVGACHTCNWVERRWPDLSRAWFLRCYGLNLYLEIVEESKKSFVPTKEYLENIINTYKDKKVD